jgi:hypothetical protein
LAEKFSNKFFFLRILIEFPPKRNRWLYLIIMETYLVS